MSEQERPKVRIGLEHPRCPYCKDAVQPGDRKKACDACMSWHHAECWDGYGRCAACEGAAVAGVDEGSDPQGVAGAGEPERSAPVPTFGQVILERRTSRDLPRPTPAPRTASPHVLDQPLPTPRPEYEASARELAGVLIVLGLVASPFVAFAVYVLLNR